jgi:membrane dipeptidase
VSAALAALVLAALAGAPPATGRAIVVDAHADSAQKITYLGLDAAKPQAMQLDLPKMRAGGLDAQIFSIWVDPNSAPRERWFAEAERQIAAIEQLARRNPGTLAMARSAADVRKNVEHGLLSALLGVEGGHALLPGDEAQQLAHLRRFAELGVRYMTLTWAVSNPIGGSSGDAGAIEGLSDFGRRVIDEMERLGIVVDVSHASDPLFWDAIRYAKRPVLASHSSSRALANVARNLTDPMLQAIAKNGGAACINYNPRFLDADFARATEPLGKQVATLPFLEQEAAIRRELHRFKPVPLARLVDHIDHAVKVAGVDHVCLGSDFDGIVPVPVGLEDVSKLPALTAELKRRGYGAGDIAKILGGNTLRVLEANEPARP